MKRLALATSIALLAALPATARADILWDLAHNAGPPGGDRTASVTLGLGATQDDVCGPTSSSDCGSIVAFATAAGVHVYVNDLLPDTNNEGFGSLAAWSLSTRPEKGLGLCVLATNCDGLGDGTFREIGDAGAAALYLDLTGVANSGPLNHIWLSSVQTNGDAPDDAYAVFYSTLTSADADFVALPGCSGTGPNIGANHAECTVTTAGIKYLKFVSTSGDFSVQALRFSSVVPEPGTMGLLATGLVALTGAGFIRRRRKH